ncbi:hypothetical protein [Pseudomonas sp. NPDC089534]|uniref:hypothetical protein n=1 Tax=Pseudomonas sp. NPDC089534 TaxID=3364468 RepID=UPI0037F26F57
MNTPNNDNQLLAINRPAIPGLTVPVIHPEAPDGGIALSLISDGTLRVSCDPWLNMTPLDFAELLLNESATAAVSKTIQTGEENLRFDLNLPAALLRNGINRLRLRVTRISQPVPETSQALVALFHTPRPGGEVAGTGNNPNLLMTLPADVIANGVDAARAAQGVAVTLRYIHLRERDVITLSADSRETTHTVTAAQAAAGSVVITLFAEAFWQDNPRFQLKYRVTDQIGNTSGPLAVWSATTEIDVHVRTPALDLKPPKVLEAKDANGTVLNFARDFYEAPHATVEVNYTGSAPGQTVKVYWVGRNSTYGSGVQTVTAAGQTLTFRVPRTEVVDCIASGAEVSYTVRLPGTQQDIPSRNLHINVTAQKHLLREPTLNADKTNLRAYYPALEAPYSVRISLTVGTTRYDSSEFDITRPDYTDVAVPPAWISNNRGKAGLFNYTLHRVGTGEPIIFSWYLRVTI